MGLRFGNSKAGRDWPDDQGLGDGTVDVPLDEVEAGVEPHVPVGRTLGVRHVFFFVFNSCSSNNQKQNKSWKVPSREKALQWFIERISIYELLYALGCWLMNDKSSNWNCQEDQQHRISI